MYDATLGVNKSDVDGVEVRREDVWTNNKAKLVKGLSAKDGGTTI